MSAIRCSTCGGKYDSDVELSCPHCEAIKEAGKKTLAAGGKKTK